MTRGLDFVKHCQLRSALPSDSGSPDNTGTIT